ncbi:GAF domain-containing protein [Thiobacter aerophilum]|uniref:GAF domain-containing protein n=1 Tax=Thiobacter aerophilum TaxID=3121275 RepID=A0ABV0EGR1_9BURK
MMGDAEVRLLRLKDLSRVLDTTSGLQDSLQRMAMMAARILNAQRCSIMLLDEHEERDVRLRVFASHGELPEAAFHETTRAGEGVAGHVLARGTPLLVEDIARSEFVNVARRLTEGGRSLISAPIVIDGQIIGVINVSDPQAPRPFNLDDLNLLEVVALFIGKSIQVVQLQGVLNSRFAQMALVREAEAQVGSAVAALGANPNQLAKMLAKSFFKEMIRAGFTASQIIHAASEIITQLNAHLGRLKRLHKERGLK